MQSKLFLTPVAAFLALSLASSVQAAEALPLQKTSLKNIQQQFRIEMPGMKFAAPQSSKNALKFLNQHTDKNKVTHVRMQQQYSGFLVYGGYAIMHTPHNVQGLLANQNADVKMNGTVYEGLDVELGAPAEDFVKNKAIALDAFKAKYAGKMVSEEQVIPMVYLDADHKAHWAYKVSVLVTNEDKIPERPTAILDAKTYKAFVQWNNIKTARVPAKGWGFGGNSKVGEVGYGKDLAELELTRDKKLARCYMENQDVKVVDMKHKYSSPKTPMSFICRVKKDLPADTFWTGYKADGYDRDNGAFSPTNDALYAGYVIKHMYHDWYDLEALTQPDGEPMQLVMRVHYGKGYENAYWDGEQMTFGDGEDMMYPLVSLGVGAHEISHGFTEQHSGLEYYGQSGGMNESFSDMAAMAAEFYSTGVPTWMIGSEIMKEDSGYEALRYMDKPSRDGESIDSADQYYSGLDVHYSSGVYNHLFYLMSQQEGWNPRMAFDVMVQANVGYWTPYATFDEAGCGVLSATADLGLDVAAVKKSLDTVAVKYDKCEVK